MSDTAWIDALEPDLARALGDRPWLRLERHRDGFWMALEDTGEGEGPAWHQLDLDGGPPVPLLPFEDHHLKGLQGAVSMALHEGRQVRLLAHKPGRRAILVAEGPEDRQILKVYRKDRLVHHRWTSLPPSADGTLRAPAVLAWDRKLRSLTLEYCPGAALHDRWREHGMTTAHGELLVRVLQWLRAQPLDEVLPAHTVDQEIAILRGRLKEFQQVLARPPVQAQEIVQRVCAALEAGRDEPLAYAHRDLHDKQVLAHGDGGYLIDLDLAARAPAGLDAGNILAHLHLRSLQGMRGDPAAVAAPLLADAHAAGLAEALPRWAAATLTRLALLYCRRRHPEGLLESLLDSARQVLDARAGAVALFRERGA